MRSTETMGQTPGAASPARAPRVVAAKPGSRLRHVAWVALLGCASCGSGVDGGGGDEISTELDPQEKYAASGLQSGGASPESTTYTWTNRSNRDLDYERFVSEPWVLVSGPVAGRLAARSSMVIEVTLDQALVSALPVGTHAAHVDYDAAGGNRSYARIDVEVRIDPITQGYSMNLQPPSGLMAKGGVGGPFVPAAKGYTWTNNGNGTLVYERVVSAPWVAVSGPSSGSVDAGDYLEFDVSLGSAVLGFDPGRYSAEVRFVDAASEQVIEVIPVEIDIVERTTSLSPSSGLSSSGPAGGPFSPISQAYVWTNRSSEPLQYARRISDPWVTVTGSASGTLGPNESLSFTVAIDAAAASGLPGGVHDALVELVDTAANAAAASIPVTLDVDGGAVELRAVVSGSNLWRTHPPGARFRVDVHVEGDPLNGATVVCRWVDAHRRPLGPDIPVTTAPTSIQSPSAEPGFVGLEFESTDPKVAFLPQPPGFPSSIYGFAVIPDPPSGTPRVDPASPFGLVQGEREDPYLWSGSGPRVTGVHLKTMTWTKSPQWFPGSIRDRTLAGHTEMPLISKEPWATDDSRPVGTAQLDAIGSQFAALLASEPKLVEHWQAGREENGGPDPFSPPYYFANLLAKMARLRAEADLINPAVKFAYSSRGRDMQNFEQLFASTAFGTYYDGLAHDPYWWPDFPSPETWLPGHIRDLRTRMDAAGRKGHFLWFGEMGLPARGTNDPNAFFGYPSTGSVVPGSTLDYAAVYLVKAHALAIAGGVERIYWYNYQNRGNDIDYAEHHFGLRTYSGSAADPGHPLPAYVAYINLLAHLKGCTFVAQRHPEPDVYVFEFAVTGTTERRLLAWVHPQRVAVLSLGALASGLRAADVRSVTDVYGARSAAVGGEQITLDGRPIYLRF